MDLDDNFFNDNNEIKGLCKDYIEHEIGTKITVDSILINGSTCIVWYGIGEIEYIRTVEPTQIISIWEMLVFINNKK